MNTYNISKKNRLITINNFLVDLNKIEMTLLNDIAITECVVQARTTENQETQLIAYVVTSGSFLPDRLHNYLTNQLPAHALPHIYVPLSTLPLTIDGYLDEAALEKIPVYDQAITTKWEIFIQNLQPIKRIAVLIEEQKKKQTSLHLDFLLPHFSKITTQPADNKPNYSTKNTKVSTSITSTLALVQGSPLQNQATELPATLPALLRQTAQQVIGEKIIYIQEDGKEITQSYADLLQIAECILAGLRQQGLQPQDKVILQLTTNQDILAAFWGCVLGGFIPVIAAIPTLYSETNRPLEQLTQVWKLLDKPLILISSTIKTAMQTLPAGHPLNTATIQTIDTLKQQQPETEHYIAQPDDPAFFNLTSGSTGVPKCIILSHRNILSRARGTNQLNQHHSNDIILNWLPFDHIGSLSDWHLRCMDLGCQLIYAPKEFVLSNPLNWLDLLSQYHITHSWAPNFAYALINDHIQRTAGKKWDLSAVKSLLTAGESVSLKVVENFLANLAPYGLKNTVIQPAFGMAEMGSGTTYFQPTPALPLKFHTIDRDSLQSSLVPVTIDHPNHITFISLGPPIPGITIRIVDNNNQLLPENTIGHFHVKGEAVTAGYYKNPEANQVFLAEGWFDTGDLGFIADGELVLTGRAKESLIINGANFYNSEIEAVIEEIKGISISYTVACAVRSQGSVEEKLALFFHTPIEDDERLLALLKQIQARITKQIGVKPDFLIPVEKQIIPKTAIGKLQRSQLTQQFEKGEFQSIIQKIDILMANDNTLPDWFYRQIWRRKQAFDINEHISQTPLLIFIDIIGLGEYLCKQFRDQQRPVIVVTQGKEFEKISDTQYIIEFTEAKHYQLLLESLSKQAINVTEILHLSTYQSDKNITDLTELEQAKSSYVHSVLFLLQALAYSHQDAETVHLQFISSGTQTILPSDVVFYQKAPLLGLIKTISQEIPWLSCHHLDLSIDSNEVNAQCILQELQVFSRETEVAYRQGQRWLPRLEKVVFDSPQPIDLPFKIGGLYIITVGILNVAIEIAKFLQLHYQTQLILLTTEQSTDNAALRQELSQFDHVTICNFTELDQVLNQFKIQENVTLAGVIHITQLPRECMLLDETIDSLSIIFDIEINRVWKLAQLLIEQAAGIFINFSSINGFFGGATVGAIAAAANFHTHFSHYLNQHTPLKSYCLNWSLWDSAGVTAEMKEMSRARGFYPVTAKQGLYAFLTALQHQQTQLLIGLDGGNQHIREAIEMPAYNIQKLTAYFSANQLLKSNKFNELTLTDQFGTPTYCHFTQLREIEKPKENQIELWPSVAEYFVYDDLLYYILTHDELRNQSYKIAMNHLVKDKIVLEIGTGKEAILARFCIEAGAKKVYAIEIGDEAYQEAIECVANLGLSDKIILIHGDSRQINELPELADVCVSEIVGPIGGCEGAAVLINDAWRFMKSDGVMLPCRSTTKIAVTQLPDVLLNDLGFPKIPGSYTEKIFAQKRHPFDLRLCIKKYPLDHLLSNADIFEDLDFSQQVALEDSHEIHFIIQKEGRFDGFLVWLNLHTMPGEVIDILKHEYCWLPVYLPVFYPGIQVSAGDVVHATCIRTLCDNGINPDFRLIGQLQQQNGKIIEFEHYSHQHANLYKNTPFYQKLFAEDAFGYNLMSRLDIATQHLAEMPLTLTNEIDREKLAQLSKKSHQTKQTVPQNAVEKQIADIWQAVLGLSKVGVYDNFFELGGHSLLLVQTQSKLQALFGQQLSLVEMFKYPTISALAAYLTTDSQEVTGSQQGQTRAQLRHQKQGDVKNNDIAVIGLSCRFPGANNIAEFWHNLSHGIESVTFFTEEEIIAAGIDPVSVHHPNYVKGNPILSDIESFDAQFFGYTAREVELLDPQQRIFLECCWEVLEDAGYNSLDYQGAIGLYAGASMNSYILNNIYPNRHLLDPQDNLDVTTFDSYGGFQLMVANDKDYLPTRTSYKLNLRGPSINVQTACSTTLVTVHLACQSLLSGECDIALAGGASVKAPQKAGHLFQEGMIVSPDGHCRTFDVKAQGTVFGSGIGVVALKRLEDAISDGDHIYAIVKGSAVNNDGLMKVGYMAPSSDGQAAVAAEAMTIAGVTADTIGFVEAHGTGTEMGDPIEVAGLTQAFRMTTDKKAFCPIGAVKTNVGHLQIASGVVGFIKAVLALYHKQIPPTLHFEQANPNIDFANSPFYVNTQLLDWQTINEQPRRAGVNSLGIGGTNAHVILEEAPTFTNSINEIERPLHLLTLSAKNEAALQQLTQNYLNWLKKQSGNLADICFTANVGRAHFEHRLAIICSDTVDLLNQLQKNPAQFSQKAKERLNIAFLFTGQGSQYVGMAKQLFETQPTFRATLEHCEAILRDDLEQSLLQVLYPETLANCEGKQCVITDSPLNETAYTQPALFAIEYALAQLWLSWGIKPNYVMGHSLGEYVAACIAGVFSLEDGLKLVAERARLMQALPQNGSMVAIFVHEKRVATAIQPYTEKVSIAAINSPENIVISGEKEAIQAIVANFTAQGVKTSTLQVSHAFHSPLMTKMLPAFEQVVKTINFALPQIPLISNLTGLLVDEEITTPTYWCHHILQSVQWVKSVATLEQQGCDTWIEIGAKPTLLGLVRQTVTSDNMTYLPSLHRDKTDWQQLLESVSTLYMQGAAFNWQHFDQDYQRRRLPLPTYPFQRQRYWIDRPKSVQIQSNKPKLHPLLESKIYSPALKTTLFETFFHTEQMPFLRDHLIYNQVVASGACHISLLLGAAELTLKQTGCVLTDVLFPHALRVPAVGCTVQLSLTPEQQNIAFQLISLEETEHWTVHATGYVSAVVDLPKKSFYFNELWHSCTQSISATQFYQLQRDRHIELGETYQWFKEIRRGENESVAQVRLPTAIADAHAYQLHPGLIDACFGLLVASVDIAVEETFVPFSIEKIVFYHKPNNFNCWLYGQLRKSSTPDRILGDMRLFDEEGQLILEIIGLEGRKANQAAMVQLSQVELRDWLYQISWQTQKLIASNNDAQGYWLIFVDKQEFGEQLIHTLEQQGGQCVVVIAGDHFAQLVDDRHYQVNPSQSDDFKRLWQACLSISTNYRGIVYLWGQDALIDDLVNAQLLANAGILHLIQALMQETIAQYPRLWLLTDNVYSIENKSDFQPQQALVWGLSRVIQLEHPELQCTCLDYDFSDKKAFITALLSEIMADEVETQISWREGQRYVARLTPHILPQNQSVIHQTGNYLITGGLGALGLQLANWLVKQGAKYLILISRHVTTDAQIAVAQLIDRGAHITLVTADVTDQIALNQALAAVLPTLPPIRGVVHAAGVLRDSLLIQQQWSDFAEGLAAKTLGAWHLHRLFEKTPLDFFVLFSSAASLLGNQGQGSYAAANAFLDGLAHYRRGRGLVATSINWSLWQQTGMARDVENNFVKQGFKPIIPEQGWAILQRILANDVTQISMIQCNWSVYLTQFSQQQQLLNQLITPVAQSVNSDFLVQLQKTVISGQKSLLTDFVYQTAQRLLGMSTTVLDIDKPLMEQGVDSLLAVEMRNRLSKEIAMPLPVGLLFNYPSIVEIVDYLATDVLKIVISEDNIAQTSIETQNTLDYLDELSADELEQLIKQDLEKGHI